MGRAVRFLVPLLVALATAGVAPMPAYAGGAGLSPLVDCVVLNGDGTYQVVFAYTNTTQRSYSYGIGKFNQLTPSSLNGIQPKTFPPGTDVGQFTTPAQPSSQNVTWVLGTATVTATSTGTACGPSVTLPTEGNGMGPLIVLGGSVLLSLGAVRVRRWRAQRAGGRA